MGPGYPFLSPCFCVPAVPPSYPSRNIVGRKPILFEGLLITKLSYNGPQNPLLIIKAAIVCALSVSVSVSLALSLSLWLAFSLSLAFSLLFSRFFRRLWSCPAVSAGRMGQRGSCLARLRERYGSCYGEEAIELREWQSNLMYCAVSGILSFFHHSKPRPCP